VERGSDAERKLRGGSPVTIDRRVMRGVGGTIRGGFVAAACSIIASGTPAATFERVRECLASNIPEKSSAMTVKLESRHRDEAEFKHESRIHWRRSPEGLSQTRICMAYPPDVRGLAYLILENESGVNLWGYLAAGEKVFPIHASAAARRARIARTAISYDDLRYLPMNLSGAEPQQVVDSIVEGRKSFVVRLSLPPGEGSPYERIISFIDDQTCVPLRTEFYATAEQLHKVVTVDPADIGRVGGIWLARSMTVEDLKNEVKTEVHVEQIEIDADLPDRMFTPMDLQRGQCP
jgi:hypothetical protein